LQFLCKGFFMSGKKEDLHGNTVSKFIKV